VGDGEERELLLTERTITEKENRKATLSAQNREEKAICAKFSRTTDPESWKGESRFSRLG